MNENLNLVEILKDCPQGTKFYSPLMGELSFSEILLGNACSIRLLDSDNNEVGFFPNGKYTRINTECLLFPSKDQRDWDKFKAPWLKKPKLDPKTLKVFDRVLVRINDSCDRRWYADFVSLSGNNISVINVINDLDFDEIIPYNDGTKHLVGTTEEAPEFYRYWED